MLVTIAVRNAFAINSIGVELLMLHCFDDAAHAFEAAHAIIEEVAAAMLDIDHEDLENEDDNDIEYDENVIAIEELAKDSYERAVECLYNTIQRGVLDNHRSASSPCLISVVTWNNITSSCYGHDNNLSSDAAVAPSAASLSRRLYTFRIEDIDCTTKYGNIYLLDRSDRDLAQLIVARDGVHRRGNAPSYIESAIMVQNHGLACMCQAMVLQNSYVTLTYGQIEEHLQYTMRSSYLLRTSAIGAIIDPHFDLVMRYSMSSTGSAALEYWMANLRLQLNELHNLSNPLVLEFVDNNVENEIRLLTDAISRIDQMYRDVVRVRAALYPLIAGSAHNSSTDQLDNISPAA